jgi:hypothetical protein
MSDAESFFDLLSESDQKVLVGLAWQILSANALSAGSAILWQINGGAEGHQSQRTSLASLARAREIESLFSKKIEEVLTVVSNRHSDMDERSVSYAIHQEAHKRARDRSH